MRTQDQIQVGTQQRWLALDVFRALAVLWMIQGHTFTALLGTGDAFEGAFGQLYRLLHGLTAPMFLLGAGLAYGIVSFSADKPPLPGRMLRRALLLLAMGTCLQLPAAPIASIVERREYLISTSQPGALQLVAACLALAELLRGATQARSRRFALAAASVGLLVALVAPWVWQLRLSSQFVLGSWLDGHNGAQFPCLPWLSFFLFGAAISAFWGPALWREPRRAPLLGGAGLVVSALCYWQFLSGQRLATIYGEHAFWFTNPMFVGFRAGLVLAWLALLSMASPFIARTLAAWPGLARVISALSRHSLIAYVVHLALLYGLPGLREPQTPFDLYECTLACAAVLWLSVLSVLYWDKLRAFVGSLQRQTREPSFSRPAQR